MSEATVKCGKCGQEIGTEVGHGKGNLFVKCPACGWRTSIGSNATNKPDNAYLPVWILQKTGRACVRIVTVDPWTAGAWTSKNELVLMLATLCPEWSAIADNADPFADAVIDATLPYPLLASAHSVRNHANV